MSTLSEALAETEERLRELSHTRDELATILSGLETMRPSDTQVPGMEACECVRLVAGAS